MAVNNTLVKAKANDKEVTYMCGNESVTLSISYIKRYLVTGDPSTVTDQEALMYLMMCKANHLNPFNKESYLIKYGQQPATMVTGKTAFEKRAEENPNYDGMEAGIVVYNEETGDIKYRTGAIYLKQEQIIGGWAEVFRKDRKHSTRIEVSFDEYAGRKKDGSMNSQWATKPATMIRKVALVQALREAFPNSLGSLYTSEEMGVEEPDATPIEQPVDVTHEPEDAPKTEPAEAESLF